jgi:hypothetical protein
MTPPFPTLAGRVVSAHAMQGDTAKAKTIIQKLCPAGGPRFFIEGLVAETAVADGTAAGASWKDDVGTGSVSVVAPRSIKMTGKPSDVTADCWVQP